MWVKYLVGTQWVCMCVLGGRRGRVSYWFFYLHMYVGRQFITVTEKIFIRHRQGTYISTLGCLLHFGTMCRVPYGFFNNLYYKNYLQFQNTAQGKIWPKWNNLFDLRFYATQKIEWHVLQHFTVYTGKSFDNNIIVFSWN